MALKLVEQVDMFVEVETGRAVELHSRLLEGLGLQ